MTTRDSDRSNHLAAKPADDATAFSVNSIHVDPDDYRSATLSDGRTIEYLVEGDPDGVPLVFHHGTPGSAVTYPSVSAAARERGLALVLFSRPGYGESTPHPDRTVAHIASDIAGVLDDIGRDEFITLGWSGGGPHSLACAALLPQRCCAAATGAGLAPFHAEGLEFFDGMGPENVAEYNAALAGRKHLVPFLEQEVARYNAVSVDEVAEALGGLMSPVDKAFAAGEFASRLLASFKHGVTHGIEGWVEDDLAFTRRWGFELSDITVPVSVWHGAEDQMVPFTHGTWLAAQVPGARLHLYDDEGHLSLWNKVDVILDDLVDRADL